MKSNGMSAGNLLQPIDKQTNSYQFMLVFIMDCT